MSLHDIDSALLHAAMHNDLAKAERCLAAGADPNVKIDYSAVWFAAANGHVDVLRRLLDAGADPDMGYPPGKPLDPGGLPIAYAIVNRREETAALLIEYGARVIEGDEFKGRLIDSALSCSQWRTAKRLLVAGARVSDATRWFPTAIEYLRTGRDEAAVTILEDFDAEAFEDEIRKRINVCALEVLDRYALLSAAAADAVAARRMRDTLPVEDIVAMLRRGLESRPE